VTAQSPKGKEEGKEEKTDKRRRGIRKKFRGFASEVLGKTASIFARHEQIEETAIFVLQKRKRENTNKPPYRILTRRKPICCIAFSHNEDEIMSLWKYCRDDLPSKLPSTSQHKSLRRWILGHFTMLAIEQNPAFDKPKSYNIQPRLNAMRLSPIRGIGLGSFNQLPPATPMASRTAKAPSRRNILPDISAPPLAAGIVSIPLQGYHTFMLVALSLLLAVMIMRESTIYLFSFFLLVFVLVLHAVLENESGLCSVIQVRAPKSNIVVLTERGQVIPFSVNNVERPASPSPLLHQDDPFSSSQQMTPVDMKLLSPGISTTSTKVEMSLCVVTNTEESDPANQTESTRVFIDLDIHVDGVSTRSKSTDRGMGETVRHPIKVRSLSERPSHRKVRKRQVRKRPTTFTFS